MPDIRGLIVDDDKGQANMVADRLRRALGKLHWQVRWTTMDDADQAIEHIAAEPPFDIVVADLLFPRSGTLSGFEPTGIEVIREARGRSDHTFIFAISVGDLASRADMLADAQREGANHVAQRGQFSVESRDHSPTAIAEEIRQHLLGNGAIVDMSVTSDRNDPAVQALLHEVGATTIAQLYRMMLEPADVETKHIHVDFVAPGASGAALCTVRSAAETATTQWRVLKLSRDPAALRQEADRCRRAAWRVPAPYLLRPQPEAPVGAVNGWYALGSQLQADARTLRAWLAGGPDTRVVEDVMDSLFTAALGDMLTGMHPADHCTLDDYPFPPYRQARILHELADLREALGRPDGGGMSDVADLEAGISAFVTDEHVGPRPSRSLPQRTYVGSAHGDLHGGNILVHGRRHPAPILIDTSRFDDGQHWATDPATLAVDLIIRCVDIGAESMFFTNIPWWRAMAADVGTLSFSPPPTGKDPATTAALVALSWLADNLRECCEPLKTAFDQHRWEWHLALCVYFLRAACHQDVPPPKRSLAMVAAHDQLLAAQDVLPS